MNDELRLKIESYLADAMSVEETAAFEQQIDNDPHLKATVELSRQINLHLSEYEDDTTIPDNEYTQELRSYMQSEDAAEIKETLRNVQLERRVPQLRSKRRRLILMAGAAAALFIVSAIGLIFQGEQGTEQLYAQYYSTNDLPSVIRRGTSNTLLEKGALAFQNSNYSDAMTFFENYEATTTEPEVALYLYKGATYMEQNQFYKAIQEFELAIDSESIDATKGFWFKAMAYLKAGDEQKARNILTDIANHVWYFNNDKAKELLKDLE